MGHRALGKRVFGKLHDDTCMFSLLNGGMRSRALAQKLSIRLSRRFSDFQLIEINSHSLFSKWFSESAKLVGKMFDEIMQVLENEDAFVVVLIGWRSFDRFHGGVADNNQDEVESLTSARKAAASGNEPSDSLRVYIFLHFTRSKFEPLTRRFRLSTRY